MPNVYRLCAGVAGVGRNVRYELGENVKRKIFVFEALYNEHWVPMPQLEFVTGYEDAEKKLAKIRKQRPFCEWRYNVYEETQEVHL